MAYPIYYVEESDTLPVFFETFDGGTGASITMTGLAVTDIEIYKDGGTTQRASDAGYTLLDTDGIDFDSLTGIHGFSIDLSDNTDSGFYAVGSWYHVVVSTITVDSQTVSFIACAFRIVSATRGMAGTALPDAAADGAGGLIVSDAGGLDADAQAASVAAIETDTSTTLQGELDGIQADTEDIQSRLPAALVGGRIDATVDGTGMEAAAAAVIVDAWETQSQADPTGFHVNVMEIGGTSQTANDNGADINSVVSAIGTPTDLGGGATLANNNADIAGATFNTSTDSNEAIRNRGDAAWTTGAGGSVLTVASGTIGATGNDTTHLHLDGLAYADDALNDLLIVVYDDSASLYYSTWITDWANSGDLATVDTLPFTPEDSTDTYVVTAIRQDVTGGSGLDAAGVRAAIGMASADLDTQLDALPTAAENRAEMDSNSTQLAAIVADTNELQTDDTPTALAAIQSTADAIETDTQDIQSRIPAALSSGNIKADVLAISTSTSAADKLEASALAIVTGTAASGTLSTTQMSTNLSEATNDHYIGRVVIWTSGDLLGQASDITDYVGTNGVLTFTEVTEAPSDGDTFVVI